MEIKFFRNKIFLTLINFIVAVWTVIYLFNLFNSKMLVVKIEHIRLLYKVVVIVILMMPINLALETQKWRIAMNKLNISFLSSFFIVISSIPYGIITPWRIGEWWGRIRNMSEQGKFFLISSLTGFAQQIITIFWGIISLLFLGFNGKKKILIISLCILVILFFIIYLVLEKRNKWFEYEKRKETVLVNLLFLSLVRYLVFATQFVLLLRVFVLDISILNLYSAVAISYLVSFLLPLNSFIELTLRSSVLIFILGNNIGVIYATVLIWIINIMFPGLVGSVLLILENFKAKY